MSEVDDAPDLEFEAANSRLNQGLKTCRTMVANYRALLASEPNLRLETPEGDGEAPETPADG